MRIIVADDEYFARKALVKSIGQLEEEIELCEAEDGTEVMELLEAGAGGCKEHPGKISGC